MAGSPAPRETGKSGYPHKFHNHEGQIPELLIPSPSPSNASSTTSHYEYPVFADGHTYDYNTKKKHREEGAQGHLRAITNQKGKLKGVIAHEGNSPQKKPHVGPMHWVPEKKYNETDKYLKDKEKSEKK